jgi:serine/threonine-protein kinase
MGMLDPGAKVGNYEVLRRLRSGGMATLFLGQRTGPAGFHRLVAIKTIDAPEESLRP